MFNPLYQKWYSAARFESLVSVLCTMPESEHDYDVAEQISYMDAADLLPAGSMYDTETGYEDWDFGPNPMPSHVLR